MLTRMKNERNRSMSVLSTPILRSKMAPVISLDIASSPTITPEIYNEYRKLTQKEQKMMLLMILRNFQKNLKLNHQKRKQFQTLQQLRQHQH